MPIRGEPDAPTFDKTTPCELLKFFYDLESLFDRAAVTSEAGKKRHVLHYVSFTLEQGWKCFSEYAKATASYSDFRDAILVFYGVLSLRSMERLISGALQGIISTTSHLYEYHMQFLAITSWLIKEEQLDSIEQKRSYIKAFHPPLLAAISQRLNLRHPDHDTRVPYPFLDVYDAAQLILQSTSQSGQPATPQLSVACSVVPESQHDAQIPSAKPLVSIISTSEQTVAQSTAHSAKAPISVVNYSEDSEPIYHLPAVDRSPAISGNYECELDMPITVTHSQLMSLSLAGRGEVLKLVAARQRRQEEASGTPPIAPVIAVLKAELPMLCSSNQAIASNIHTSSQANKEAYTKIPKENMLVAAPVITTCTDTVYIAPLSIYKVPHIKAMHNGSLVRSHPLRSYIHSLQLAPVRQGQYKECAAIYMDVEPSAPFALHSILSLDFATGHSEFAFNPSSSPQSITTCIVVRRPPLKLALQGLSQRTIYKDLPAAMLRKLPEPSHFSYPIRSYHFSSSSSYIVSSNRFPHLAVIFLPKHPLPIDIIAYPPRRLPQLVHSSCMVAYTIALAITMFYDLFSAVRHIAAALASLYTTPALISRQFQPLQSAVLIACLLLGGRAATVYFASFLTLLCVFEVVAQVTSSMRDPIYLWHDNIALAWSPSHRFASGHIFISRESPRPLKPDKNYSRLAAHYPASSDAFTASNSHSALVPSLL
jgi:hypothetical protein